MSGFANSIIGGMSNLIRKAIQSPDYVTGQSGWTINKDGSAEFNSGTFRGEILVGPDGMPQVLISADGTHGFIQLPTNRPIEDVPAELQALISNSGAADESLRLGLFSPRLTGDTNGIGVTINSPAADGSFTEFFAVSSSVQAGLLFITRDAILLQGPVTATNDVNISGSLTASNIQTGTESVTFSTNTGHIRTVTIPAMPAAPTIVVPVISNGGSPQAGWTCRTDTYTTTSFRLILNGPSAAWTSVPVRWLALTL